VTGAGRLFEQVPELYDRVRPGYPGALFADLGLGPGDAVLEVGCGTGQATRSLTGLGCAVTAVEPGPGLAALARRRGAAVEVAAFEEWDDRGRRFDAVVAASSWHWVDPAAGWARAHALLRPGGRLALLGNVVVRVPGAVEVYAETADLHERFSPGNPGWGHPPTAEQARAAGPGWAHRGDSAAWFAEPVVRWYPAVQWFDGAGFAGLLRSTSLYRALPEDVREPLLDAIAERIRTRLGDRVPRHYLSVLRTAPRLSA
jgi:SAM-dependent methyltransferase